ncbi:transposase-like protein [Roseomonas pecuniae]|uniref:Transposase-like protein n=1 Tax=Muricoccus pecuniae TaxID=693023 RepID=A0A840Y8M9_9PROT|nr:transposase-like protein [Roseomonas pecuniae]
MNPRGITVDKHPAYPGAIEQLKGAGEPWRFARLRQCNFLNNIVEQDHRRVKRLVRPGLGFGGLHTTQRTLAGYEATAMMRRGQVRDIDRRDMRAQTIFIAALFQVSA